jgi:hypothetical protein
MTTAYHHHPSLQDDTPQTPHVARLRLFAPSSLHCSAEKEIVMGCGIMCADNAECLLRPPANENCRCTHICWICDVRVRSTLCMSACVGRHIPACPLPTRFRHALYAHRPPATPPLPRSLLMIGAHTTRFGAVAGTRKNEFSKR